MTNELVPAITQEEIEVNEWWLSPFWAPGFNPANQNKTHEEKCALLDEKIGPVIDKVVRFSLYGEEFDAIIKGVYGSYLVLDRIKEIPYFHEL
jgi:hypothetical protein